MSNKYIYCDRISNYYLGKMKIIKGRTIEELKYKKNEQLKVWDEQEKRERKKNLKDQRIHRTIKNTEKARAHILEYENILNYRIHNNYKIDFSSYKRNTRYKNFEYVKEKVLLEQIYEELNVPKKSFLEIFFESMANKRKISEEKAKEVWQKKLNEINRKYNDALEIYNMEKEAHERNEKNINDDIINWENNFKVNKKFAVERYINEALRNSQYPEAIIKDYEIEYNEEEKRIIILYKMPNPKNVPDIVEYKYIKTRDEVDIKLMKSNDFDKFYDNIIYQIALRNIYESFILTNENCIDQVVFNGWVDYIDEATGQDASSCIISIMVSRDNFNNIDLSRVKYKECVKKLKGVFAGKLVSLTPITPILNLSREDERFIENKEVLAKIKDGTNLAAMRWEEFEHLVRELFEHRFAKAGGEVKITRASRDGGVDAVIFDPDPFKGGKFIIQAKRYNNNVPVTAVRDLYGTMMHEQAIRGILVTTSSYGNDSYEFAKGKALTLINGNELLAMFNELGHYNLRIDLWEKEK